MLESAQHDRSAFQIEEIKVVSSASATAGECLREKGRAQETAMQIDHTALDLTPRFCLGCGVHVRRFESHCEFCRGGA